MVASPLEDSFGNTSGVDEMLLQSNSTFTDTDGPANGGDFAAKTVDIEFTEAERTAKGDGDWDQGAFAKSGVDIALEEKE